MALATETPSVEQAVAVVSRKAVRIDYKKDHMTPSLSQTCLQSCRIAPWLAVLMANRDWHWRGSRWQGTWDKNCPDGLDLEQEWGQRLDLKPAPKPFIMSLRGVG